MRLPVLLTAFGTIWSDPLFAATEAIPVVQQPESSNLASGSVSGPRPLPKYLVLTAPSKRESEYQQEKKADLVVYFTTWASLQIKESPQSVLAPIGKAELRTYVQAHHIGNALAVVVFSKRQPIASTVDDVTAEFHALGFARVIVQQAANFEGRAVLKDSSARCSISPPAIILDTAAKNIDSCLGRPVSH